MFGHTLKQLLILWPNQSFSLFTLYPASGLASNWLSCRPIAGVLVSALGAAAGEHAARGVEPAPQRLRHGGHLAAGS
jgi:hypothetical protein